MGEDYRLKGPLSINFYDGTPVTPVLLHNIPVDVVEVLPFKVEPQVDELRSGAKEITHHKVTAEIPLDSYNPSDLGDLNTTECVEVTLLSKNKVVTLDKATTCVKAMSVYTSLEGPEPKIHIDAVVVTTDGDWTAALPVTDVA